MVRDEGLFRYFSPTNPFCEISKNQRPQWLKLPAFPLADLYRNPNLPHPSINKNAEAPRGGLGGEWNERAAF